MQYNCIIVDDEALARELLTGYIQKVPYLNLVGAYASAIEASQALRANVIDLMFLDIEMPHLTGLDFLKNLKNIPATIFTTAYSEYAIEAFTLEVVDYLLKPIEFDRFFQGVQKALKTIEKTSSSGEQSLTNETEPIINQPTQSGNDYFFVKTDQKIVKVRFAEVLFIEGLQKYVKIYLSNNEVLICLVSLSHLLETLPSPPFIRIHRSYILNIDHIQSIQGNTVTIDQHHLPVSKGQRNAFFQLIDDKRID